MLELERQEDEIGAQRDDNVPALTPKSGTNGPAVDCRENGWAGGIDYSVGHSTRTLEEFIGLLQHNDIVYADSMQTAEFARGLAALRALSAAGPVALMCAEAVPWRCHRSLIADALFVRGVVANDIQSLTRTMPHVLTPFARVNGERIAYPDMQPPTLSDQW